MYYVGILAEMNQVIIYSEDKYKDMSTMEENLVMMIGESISFEGAKEVADDTAERYNYTVRTNL